MAEWKKISDFSNHSVSSCGEIRNDKKGNILKPCLSRSGYHYVHFVRQRRKHLRYIHRLVCQAFLGDRPNMQVDHINGDKTDNRLENLRWVTVRQNCAAYGTQQRALALRRPVEATHADGRKIVFESRLAAAEHFNCSSSKIRYGHEYAKSDKKGWTFSRVEDIV